MPQSSSPLCVTRPFVAYAHDLSNQNEIRNILDFLEKKQSLNPNLLLFFLWFSQSERGRLTTQHIKAIMSNLCAWHERIALTLNNLHQKIDTQPSPLSEDIKNSIASEANLAKEVEQCLIADTLLKTSAFKRTLNQQLTDACHAIINYSKVLKTYLDSEDWQHIATLLQHAFPTLTDTAIQKASQLALSRSSIKDSAHSEQLSFGHF